MKIQYVTDIEVFRPLCEVWMQKHNAADFGLKIDLDVITADAKEVLAAGGVLMGAKLNDEWVGVMLLFVCRSFLGEQDFAIEKYWFAKPNLFSVGPAMLEEAKRWTKDQGCSHLVMSASNLASDLHDTVCAFYEMSGLKQFETSYIYEV